MPHELARISTERGHTPVCHSKQAVISASALSLLYPPAGIEGYPREQFLDDLVREADAEIQACLQKGAFNVQIDFTEARLSVKLDPSRQLLRSFIDLNNRVLERMSADERLRIGVHTCPGGDKDSTHSADVDYAELLPALFNLHATRFYIQLASEPDRRRVLGITREHARPDQLIYVGVTDPINPTVETPEQVCDRVMEGGGVYFRSIARAALTTVASRPSATIYSLLGKPRFRRSEPAWLGRKWQPKSSAWRKPIESPPGTTPRALEWVHLSARRARDRAGSRSVVSHQQR